MLLSLLPAEALPLLLPSLPLLGPLALDPASTPALEVAALSLLAALLLPPLSSTPFCPGALVADAAPEFVPNPSPCGLTCAASVVEHVRTY